MHQITVRLLIDGIFFHWINPYKKVTRQTLSQGKEFGRSVIPLVSSIFFPHFCFGFLMDILNLCKSKIVQWNYMFLPPCFDNCQQIFLSILPCISSSLHIILKKMPDNHIISSVCIMRISIYISSKGSFF